MKAKITTIQRMSLHDGPGIRSTLFLKGCNFRCPWCHNPETLSPKIQLQYISSKCIACGTCVTACQRGALSLKDGVLRISRSLCDVCGKCSQACLSGALNLEGQGHYRDHGLYFRHEGLQGRPHRLPRHRGRRFHLHPPGSHRQDQLPGPLYRYADPGL